MSASSVRVGVFIDTTNISRNGGYGMRYEVLRAFACRDGAVPVRLNAYVAFDEERAERDPAYRRAQENFWGLVRDFGYKVIRKPVNWYEDESGNRYGKANADLDLTVDLLHQGLHLDRVLLATGDGDFTRVVRVMQNRGCRIEVVAFENVATSLREEADYFMSGYLIPDLLPTERTGRAKPWGETGSRVRGICYSHTGKGYGFLRFMTAIGPGVLTTDTRAADSPYESIFLHDSRLPEGVLPSMLPSRSLVFEFEIKEEEGQKARMAENVVLVSGQPRRPRPATSGFEDPIGGYTEDDLDLLDEDEDAAGFPDDKGDDEDDR